MPQVILNKVNNSKLSLVFDTGDHVLGRGVKLMCDSKKVSRNHAVLKVNSEGVFLHSTHNNPCFHQPNQNIHISIVTFGNSVQINNDDKIALSLEHGWFKLLIQPENTPNLAEANTEIGLHVDSNRKRCITNETTDNNNKKIKIENAVIPATEIKLEPQSENPQQLCSGFTVNPGIVKVEPPENNQTSDEALDIFLRADEASRVSENLQNAGEPPEASSGISGNLENAVEPEASGVPETVQNAVVTPEITQQTAEDTASEVQIDNVNTTDSNNETVEVKTEVKEEPEVDKPSTSGTNNRVWKDRCWYGKTCYRKNVGHRAEFRHFGDPDYDSDSNDARPICCYGAGCYRKNSEHRRKYRHPGQDRLPQKPQQAAPPPNPPKSKVSLRDCLFMFFENPVWDYLDDETDGIFNDSDYESDCNC